jgi:hypothetical protein
VLDQQEFLSFSKVLHSRTCTVQEPTPLRAVRRVPDGRHRNSLMERAKTEREGDVFKEGLLSHHRAGWAGAHWEGSIQQAWLNVGNRGPLTGPTVGNRTACREQGSADRTDCREQGSADRADCREQGSADRTDCREQGRLTGPTVGPC